MTIDLDSTINFSMPVSSANAGNLDQLCVHDFLYRGPDQDHHLAMFGEQKPWLQVAVYCDKPNIHLYEAGCTWANQCSANDSNYCESLCH